MKKLVFTLALCLFAGAAFAQVMFPQEGKVMEYSMKVKSPMGDQDLTAKQYLKSKTATEAVVVTDAMGQNMETVYTLADNQVTLSLKNLLASSMGAAAGSLEVVEGTGLLVYPFELEVGKEYEPITAKIKGNMQGMELSMDLSMENRKAEAKESVTVPAGTFECVKLVEELVIKVMGQEQITETTSWYAIGVGLVKQTTNALNGMVANTMELTKISDK